jgi:hypothetical protein
LTTTAGSFSPRAASASGRKAQDLPGELAAVRCPCRHGALPAGIPAPRAPLSLRRRTALLVFVAMTAISTCFWRTQVGHRFLPGLFTVVCVPLAVSFFVVVDLRVRFGLAEWIAVIGVIAAHLVLSVPAFPDPLYYRGTHLFRPDHYLHLFAGGLVAWLCCDVIEPRASGWKLSPNRVAALAFLITMGFGFTKEVTDFLSVTASGLKYDAVDTVEDLASNGLGAALIVVWRLRGGLHQLKRFGPQRFGPQRTP